MIIYDKEFEIEKSFINQLTFLYGISTTRSKNICALLGFKKHIKINNLELKNIQEELFLTTKDIIDRHKNYIIENSLKHQNLLKRKDLKLLGNYKSLRLTKALI